MDLFGIEILREVMTEVDIDKGLYLNNDDINHIREVMNVLFTYREIGCFYTLTMRRRKPNTGSLLDALYDVLDATNNLAYEYYKHNNKIYSYGKVYYSYSNRENLKAALDKLNTEICKHLTSSKHDVNFMTSALNLIFQNTKLEIARQFYLEQKCEEMDADMLKNGELNDHLLDYFTDFDQVVNPFFKFTLIKSDENIYYNSPFMIDLQVVDGDFYDIIRRAVKLKY